MPKNTKLIEKIASERIERLYELSTERFRENSSESKALGKRYVRLIRLISSHYNVKLSSAIRNRLCKSCSNILIPGITCTVRIIAKEGYSIYKCECGNQTRVYMKESSLGS